MPGKGSFLRWWLLVCLQGLAIAVAMVLGFHEVLWENDRTKLVFVIGAVWFFSTILIGYWHHVKSGVRTLLKVGFYLSYFCFTLGLTGTVIGFIFMLGSFQGINVEDTASVQNTLSEMAAGMGTAFYTTLIGLIAGEFLKQQMVNLEHMVDRRNEQ